MAEAEIAAESDRETEKKKRQRDSYNEEDTERQCDREIESMVKHSAI
jgi:hypothetical protein